MKNELQYAVKNNSLIHISDVDSGLKCGCLCPACGSQLVAKKGSRKIHHFSHHNTEECRNGYESSIHLATKEIIQRRKEIVIPDVFLNFPKSYKEKQRLFESRRIYIDNVFVEKRLDNIKPDIIVESKGNCLLIEIYVTHKVDDDKLAKIKELAFSAIEIDLSKIGNNIAKEDFEDLIINDTSNKVWLNNTIENKFYNDFKRHAKPFVKTQFNTNSCPLNKYSWKGISSARWEDCLYCEYCFSIDDPPNCLGYSLVSKLEDFSCL